MPLKNCYLCDMKRIIPLFLALALLASCSKDKPETLTAPMPTTKLEKLSFENYKVQTTKDKYGFHVFYEEDIDGTRYDVWASGNEGAALANSRRNPEKFPTFASPDGYEGYCACMNTQATGTFGNLIGKPIAAGSLFLGNFNMDKAMTDELKTTEFGIPVDRQPRKVVGWYKYTPGKTYIDRKRREIKDQIDSASVTGVFWRNENPSGKKIVLYGDDYNTNPYVVSRGRIADIPISEDWARFEMVFEGDEADPEILADWGYSFTVLFSSSRNGGDFEGAVGSTFMVDEVEVVF